MDKAAISFVKKGERIDEIGFGGLKLIQKPDEFCYGVDSVILADFAAKRCKKKPDVIVDLGTGTGVIPLILCHKTHASIIYGIDVQKEACEKAVRNAVLNRVEDRLTFLQGDVKDEESVWLGKLRERADMVICNPPYFKAGGAVISEHSVKAVARHEIKASLEDFMRCASCVLKDKGELFMVHRPSRIVDLCCFGRKYGLEMKEIRFVSPEKGKVPNILLVHFVKGGGAEVKILPELAIHETNGTYTDELLQIYEKSYKPAYDY